MSGTIAADVEQGYLRAHPKHRGILRPFLEEGFSVTFGARKSLHNTELSFFFLRPSADLRGMFGFEYEVLLVYSHFDSLESRTMQAIDAFMQTLPARGRVEGQVFLLVSDDPDASEWVRRYLLEHRDARLGVAFSRKYLAESKSHWKVQDRIRENYFVVDRFKDSLPIQNDAFFFGREVELRNILDCVSRSENIGVFGLRKTGKTSLLLKAKRSLALQNGVTTVFLDAQSSSVRKRRWWMLIELIARELDPSIQEGGFSEINAESMLQLAIKSHLSRLAVSKVVVILDEIEWISPGTSKDEHWRGDFTDFWQVLRALQTIDRSISFLLAGVSPASVEASAFQGYQNPLFGIVNLIFLRGLTQSEVSDMVQKIGKVSGLQFAPETVSLLFSEYGGHPLLTRLACSITREFLRSENRQFPYRVTAEVLRRQREVRDRELAYYPQHIVFELQKYYESEYELLETLAAGDMTEFMRRSSIEGGAVHLYRYGVVENPGAPYIPIRVVEEFVAREEARRCGRSTRMRVVDLPDRQHFTNVSMSSLMGDMRALERLIREKHAEALWGPVGFPEADRLTTVSAPSTPAGFGQALTALQRCWVESIENFGASIGVNKYFHTLKASYPDLYRALNRVRIYRHDAQHLFLNSGAEGEYQGFLLEDLEDGVALPDRPWFLFQKVLLELQRAVHVEISRLESSS